MFHQAECVPQRYELREDAKQVSKPGSHLSIDLQSTDAAFETSNFQFEALGPNLFRTTFTTSKHPLPPFPAAQRPEPKFGDKAPRVETNLEKCTRVFNTGQVKAEVSWSGPPIVTLYLDGQDKPIHRDLEFRSYAIDNAGTAHYTVYNKDTLHVGLGEKAAPMNLAGRGFQITASDTFGYDAYRTDPLYKHIPLLINVTPTGCVGTFSTSHSRAAYGIGSEIDGLWGRFKVYRQSHGGLEEYLMVGKTVADVVRTYAELVGFPLLVPRYMMGYIGGGMKYSMEDSPRACESILNFIKNAESHGMPCSAFQMSSGYTVAETEPKTRNVMTWNRHRFPDPRAFTKEAHAHGVRLLGNVKPYVLKNHPAYAELAKGGAFFTDPVTKKTAEARLWSAGGGESGVGGHIDFTSKAGFDWWFNGVKALKQVGIDVMWNDNNEYNTPSDEWQCALETVNVPKALSRKDIGLWGRALHTELHGKSSHDATAEAEPKERPFVLTRSATAGTMKYCASSWSGDNVTSWDGMRGANSLALNASFSLLHCYGHDIGGFEGPQPTPEHLVRWIQLGVHSPRFAINCYKTSPEDNLVGEVIEPWQYPTITPIIRATIKRRYQLVPYTYAQSLKAHREAIPPQRWTGWGYESDPTVWSPELLKGETQYWFGDALLIAGIYEPGVSSARVYLPKRELDAGFLNLTAPYQYLESGQWHDISSPWQTSIPVLARIGSAVPIGKTVPTVCVADEDPEFPNLAKDDWRGVEIFPPPIVPGADIPPKMAAATNGSHVGEVRATNGHHAEKAGATNGSHAGESGATNGHHVGESGATNGHHAEKAAWFSNEWLEDDGISPDGRAEVFESSISYAVENDEVQVKLSFKKHGSFEPLWVKNGLNVVLPVNEERNVVLAPGQKGKIQEGGRDEKGRLMWKIDVVV